MKSGTMGISVVDRVRIRGIFPCEFVDDFDGSLFVLDPMGKKVIFSGLIRTTSLGKNGTLVFGGPGDGTLPGIDFDAVVQGRDLGSYGRNRSMGWGQEILLDKPYPGGKRKKWENKDYDYDKSVFIFSFQNVISKDVLWKIAIIMLVLLATIMPKGKFRYHHEFAYFFPLFTISVLFFGKIRAKQGE